MLRSVVLFVLVTGCAVEQPLEEDRLEQLYRAGRSIDGAIAVGVDYPKFSELLQGLSTEIMIASDQACNAEEMKAVNAYRELLAVYEDSSSLWQLMLDNASWRFYQGNIGELKCTRIAAKYGVSPSVTKEGAYTSVIFPESTLRTVWEAASEKSRTAAGIYLALRYDKSDYEN